jgi:carbon storage regulator
MLVLSRGIGQSVNIGGAHIIVKVLSIKGDKVRLGIDAPKAMTVHRAEVQQRIDTEDVRNDN